MAPLKGRGNQRDSKTQMTRAPKLQLVRIIRSTRDARLDYFIPRDRAAELYAEGKLGMAQVYATCDSYITHRPTDCPR